MDKDFSLEIKSILMFKIHWNILREHNLSLIFRYTVALTLGNITASPVGTRYSGPYSKYSISNSIQIAQNDYLSSK